MTELDPSDKKLLPDEPVQEAPKNASSFQEFLEAVAKANGVSTEEATAAFEENGWDVIIMEEYNLKP